MVQTVSLPFGALNNIPGVSGIEDVEFEVPEREDVRDVVEEAVLSADDVAAELGEEVGDAVGDAVSLDELAAALGAELEDRLDVTIPETVELDIQGSLFDVDQDLVDLFSRALEDVDLEIPDPTAAIEDLQDTAERVLGAVEDLDVPDTGSIERSVESAVSSALDGALPDWVTQPVDEVARDLVERALEQAIDDETSEELRKLAERYSNEPP